MWPSRVLDACWFPQLVARRCNTSLSCQACVLPAGGVPRRPSEFCGKIYDYWGTPPYSWGGALPPPRCITHTLVQPPGPPGVPQAPSPYHSSRVTAEAETAEAAAPHPPITQLAHYPPPPPHHHHPPHPQHHSRCHSLVILTPRRERTCAQANHSQQQQQGVLRPAHSHWEAWEASHLPLRSATAGAPGLR